MKTPKTVFHWSGGKDSSIALHLMLKIKKHQIDRLFTTISSENSRVTMHGVRKDLIHRQAISLGLPITFLELPNQPQMDEYNRLMTQQMQRLKKEGFTHAAFGDIYLEDLKLYRQKQMEKAGLKSVFPIWKKDTTELIRQFIDDGFKAIIVSVQADKLGKKFAGREINSQFLKDLPDNVDPCGENGEFHTFVFDGPIFSKPISVKKGITVYKEYNAPGSDTSSAVNKSGKMGFWFCELLPG